MISTENESTPRPTLGRVVLFHYRAPNEAQWITCPAVVTSAGIFGDPEMRVNLHVLHDADEEVAFSNDKQRTVPYGALVEAAPGEVNMAKTIQRRWSWPPRV